MTDAREITLSENEVLIKQDIHNPFLCRLKSGRVRIEKKTRRFAFSFFSLFLSFLSFLSSKNETRLTYTSVCLSVWLAVKLKKSDLQDRHTRNDLWRNERVGKTQQSLCIRCRRHHHRSLSVCLPFTLHCRRRRHLQKPSHKTTTIKKRRANDVA